MKRIHHGLLFLLLVACGGFAYSEDGLEPSSSGDTQQVQREQFWQSGHG